MDSQYTLDDMLRLGAENSRLKAQIAALEGRLTDEQVVEFAAKVCETAKVVIWDRVTQGPAALVKQVFHPQDIHSELRSFRRIGR